MRLAATLAAVLALSGCSTYFSVRPPVIEDKVGKAGEEIIGTLATAPDYRVVYVKIKDDAKICAEAPADAAAQFGSAVAAGLATPLAAGKELSAQATVSLAVAMKQLFRRSQGVQLYRDATFALCNLYLNKGLKADAYLEELREIRKTAAELIRAEIPHLEKQTIDPAAAPTPATVAAPVLAPAPKSGAAAPTDGTKKE